MIGTKQKRELKPGDLYVVTAFGAILSEKLSCMKIGDVLVSWEEPPMKLVCRHSCGALEFLVLPPEKSS